MVEGASPSRHGASHVMVNWIAFLAILGIPIVWFIVGGRRGDSDMEVPFEEATDFFRTATDKREMRNSVSTVDEVHRALAEFLAKFPGRVPNPIGVRMEIAVAEVAANIFQHSDGRTIWMDMALGPNTLQVTFTDDGAPAEIDLSTVSMPADLVEEGWGLPLVQAALKNFSYRHDERGNHWKLVSEPFSSIG